MKRVLFKLSMPNRGSWNGKWSGSGNNYTITKNMKDETARKLGLDKGEKSWYHSFGDGWTACVAGKILQKGEKTKKSDGFCGYDWMVTDIVLYGRIEAGHLVSD